MDGAMDGLRLGAMVGDRDGATVGLVVGTSVGAVVGDVVGALVGDSEMQGSHTHVPGVGTACTGDIAVEPRVGLRV